MIEPAWSFANDLEPENDGNKNRKLPMVEIQGACIDPVQYQVIASFHKPAIQARVFDFSPELDACRIQTQNFTKNISGLLLIGQVYDKKGSVFTKSLDLSRTFQGKPTRCEGKPRKSEEIRSLNVSHSYHYTTVP